MTKETYEKLADDQKAFADILMAIEGHLRRGVETLDKILELGKE